jgi:flagellar biosynthesis chaperone FliJ
MAHSSASKKSNKDDSGSDSEEEVNNDPSFLLAKNARLNDFLDNHDDMLRKTNKEKREYRSLLREAKEKVVELEFLLDGARAQIDSLKSAPILTNEPECTDCSTFLGELTMLKENYASKVEELDVLRVELDEMKSRPSLLGAYTSCPVLQEKLDVSLVYAKSLEAQLKAPIPTSCSTCKINATKNMELAHYVDRLQDENDELRKMMGWLSAHEPQLRMMIKAYKRYDGQALGSDKVGEGSGENEGKISDIPELPNIYHKNAYAPKPNPLRNRLDTTPAPPVFPPQTDNFQKPIKFKSNLGKEFFGKKGEKPSEEKPEPKENPKPKPKPKPFHCEHCGRDGHLAEFCFSRKREVRLAR